MSVSDKGAGFLKEFRDFIAFLQSVWGILAGISVVFPLSNTLIKVIPLGNVRQEQGGLAFFSPQFVTTVTTIIALFIILWTFGQRDKFKSQRKRGLIRRQAWLSFAIGLLTLIVYIVANLLMRTYFYQWVAPELEQVGVPELLLVDHPHLLLGDIVLLLSYSAFFALISRAFMLLGMTEFYQKEA